MESDRQALEVGVEDVPQGRLEAEGGVGEHEAPQAGHGRLDQPEEKREASKGEDAGPAVVRHRPVHHRLGHERDEGADDQAHEGRGHHDRQLFAVRADVGTQAPERDVVQGASPRRTEMGR